MIAWKPLSNVPSVELCHNQLCCIGRWYLLGGRRAIVHFHLQTSLVSSISEKRASRRSSVWLLVGSVSTDGAINEFLIMVFFGCSMCLVSILLGDLIWWTPTVSLKIIWVWWMRITFNRDFKTWHETVSSDLMIVWVRCSNILKINKTTVSQYEERPYEINSYGFKNWFDESLLKSLYKRYL